MLASSCKKNEVLNSDITYIDVNPDHSNKIKFINLIDSMYLIPLETKQENIIGTIKKIEVDHNNFYIIDYDGSPLQVYDRSGGFRHFIGRNGRGGGEYSELNDFYITSNKIGILDFKKVIHYSHLGEYQNSINLDELSTSFQPLGENAFIHYISNGVAVDNTTDYLYTSGANMKPQKYFLKKGKYTDKFSMEMNVFCPTEDGLRLRTDMSNIIYTYQENIEDNPLIPTYGLNFGKYFPNDNFWKSTYKLDPISFFDEYMAQYIYFLRYRENRDFVCLSYSLHVPPNPHFTVYSKRDKVSYDFEVMDSDPFTYFFNRIMCNDGDWLIAEISALDLIKVGDKLSKKVEKTSRFSDEIVRLSEQIEPSHNPIIVAIKLKDPLN